MESQNEYATVQVVSIDGRPIAASKKLLVQAGTTERLTGFESKPVEFEFEKRRVKGEEILNTGHPPRLIANAADERKATSGRGRRPFLSGSRYM